MTDWSKVKAASSDYEAAIELVFAINAALANGVRHYSINGIPLTTPKQIVDALLADGRIIFERPEEVHVNEEIREGIFVYDLIPNQG